MSREDEFGKSSGIPLEKIEHRCIGSLHLLNLLVAIGLHARCSGGFSVGSCQRLGISLMEHCLEDLLLFGAEDLGQVLVKLGLLGLKAYRED